MPDETVINQPNTAAEALAIWDEGKNLRAFRVATDGATQEEIYAAAFEMIRGGQVSPTFAGLDRHEKLTEVEHAAAHSIAFVAVRSGWAAMVQSHIHPNSPEITIRKPA